MGDEALADDIHWLPFQNEADVVIEIKAAPMHAIHHCLLEHRGFGGHNELVPGVAEIETVPCRFLHGSLHVVVDEEHVLSFRDGAGFLSN